MGPIGLSALERLANVSFPYRYKYNKVATSVIGMYFVIIIIMSVHISSTVVSSLSFSELFCGIN